MLFTGYYIQELNKSQKECLQYIDLLIDGRFENSKKGDFLWRGSSNQTIYSPSSKYTQDELSEIAGSPSNGLEVKISNNSIYFYGIPKGDEIKLIKKSLNRQGVIS